MPFKRYIGDFGSTDDGIIGGIDEAAPEVGTDVEALSSVAVPSTVQSSIIEPMLSTMQPSIIEPMLSTMQSEVSNG